MTVGEIIRKYRLERGLTQQQLGDAIGVNGSYIRAYESGKRNPKFDKLEKIAKVLQVDIEDLYDPTMMNLYSLNRLMRMFHRYNGEMFEYTDSDGNKQIALSFKDLDFIWPWYERYSIYKEKINECSSIEDENERNEAILKATSEFENWMNSLSMASTDSKTSSNE